MNNLFCDLSEYANKNLDRNNNYCLILFNDFSKPFVVLPHKILLNALASVGVSGPVRSWFESYSSGLSFRVR